jgi:predicted enzyme related to lactoylglutathione lyase
MIGRINWFEVKVSDMKEAVLFYRDILGLKVKKEWSNYVIFDLPGTLTFAIMPGGRRGRKDGAINLYFAVENLDAAHEKLTKKGVRFVEPSNQQYWGGYAAIFADPDENRFYLAQTEK